MNFLIWFFAGAMTGVTFSRFAELVRNVFDSYLPPAPYLPIFVGAVSALAMGFAINRLFTEYAVFSFGSEDFDFPAVLAAFSSAILSLLIFYIFA